MRYENEDYVKVSRICFSVIRKWKALFILLLVGVVLGGGFSTLKQNKTIKNQTDSSVNENSINRTAVYQYTANAADIESRLYRQKNSILFQLSPEETWTGTLKYALVAENPEIFMAIDAFREMVNDKELTRECSAIVAAADEVQLTDVFYVACEIDPELVNNIEANTSYYAALNLFVFGYDQEQCEKMLEIVENAVQLKQTELTGRLKSLKLDEESRYVDNRYNEDIEGILDEYIELLEKSAKRENDLIKKLTSTDLMYIEQNYPHYVKWSPVSGGKAVFSIKNVLKYAIVGGVGLPLIFALFVVLSYMLSMSVREEEDVQEMFELPLLGCINTGISKKGLSGAIERRIEKFVITYHDAASISESIKSRDYNEILLTGANGEKSKTTPIAKSLSTKDDRIRLISALNNEPSIRKMAEKATGVILVIELGKMSRVQLAREKAVADEIGLRIIGVVTVR